MGPVAIAGRAETATYKKEGFKEDFRPAWNEARFRFELELALYPVEMAQLPL